MPIRILFVCLGNICRSPMAHGIALARIRDSGLHEQLEVDSAGTAAYHAGEAADPRTVAELRRHGAPADLVARKVRSSDFEHFDLIIAMDRSNYRDLKRVCPSENEHKVRMALELTTLGEVPDPYYGGVNGFADVYNMLDEAMDAWFEELGIG